MRLVLGHGLKALCAGCSDHRREQFRRGENGNGGPPEVLAVASDDGSRLGRARRFVEDGVLVAGKVQRERVDQDGSVDGYDVKDSEKLPKLSAGPSHPIDFVAMQWIVVTVVADTTPSRRPASTRLIT